jgi:hypothetical protein
MEGQYILMQNVSEWDYLKETDDYLRLGAFRYKDEQRMGAVACL